LQLQSLEHRAGRVDLFELGIRKAGLFVFWCFEALEFQILFWFFLEEEFS
jgi:hypothetical protein